MRIFIRHPGGGGLQPSSARVAAYKNFFESRGFINCSWDIDEKRSFVKLWLDCVLRRYDGVLLSMPPFRGWGLFFLPFTRIIIDIRDGWSIAMESGYGGSARKKFIKARIARVIERWAIRRSFAAITCTTGLQEYLQKISGRQVLLITNGVSDRDLQLADEIHKRNDIKKNPNELIFCCAGQFSEYHENGAKKILETIAKRYSGGRRLVIRLIGSDREKNQWLPGYFEKLTQDRGSVEILPKMGRRELYEILAKGDYGLSLVRDPDYEFGTKIFDYIALKLPVVNYFDSDNNFTDYFSACLDVPFGQRATLPEIRRSVLIEAALSKVELFR